MGLGRFARVALGVAARWRCRCKVASTAYSAYEGYQREGLKGAASTRRQSHVRSGVGPSEDCRCSDGRLAIAQMAAERSAGRGAYEARASRLRWQPPEDEQRMDGRLSPVTGGPHGERPRLPHTDTRTVRSSVEAHDKLLAWSRRQSRCGRFG